MIEDSPITQTTVKLLTAKFVNTSTKKQDDNAEPVIFDNSTNIYANASIKTEVESYISSLGINVVTSGLLSCDDLDGLTYDTFLMGGDEMGWYCYWLNSPDCDDGYAWQGCITSDFGRIASNYDWGGVNDTYYFLRPFIEVLKVDISS